MKIEDILAIEDPLKIITILCKDNEDKNVALWQDEFNGEHKVLDEGLRKDKWVGEGDARVKVPVAREVVTFQKKIVRAAVAFLLGKAPRLILKNDDSERFDDAYNAISDIWKDNKLDYFDKKLMRSVCIETEAAELWYIDMDPVTKEKKYHVLLLSEANGNFIYPHFNDSGDMDAFVRKYDREYVDDVGAIKTNEVIELYTADMTYTYANKNGWSEESREKNLSGKIQVIYYRQDKPEWGDVQTLIDRLEIMISRHADLNDYYGSPILGIKGKIKKLPEKTEDGRVLQFEPVQTPAGGFEYGSADFITWTNSPESLKLEYNNLVGLIYAMTSTPDIAFDNVKGITNLSGIALKLMFLDAILKANEKEEIYGEGFTRRINLLRAMVGETQVPMAKIMKELDIDVEFQSPLPQNFVELIESLATARGGEATMSRQTAVRTNPFVDDPDAEIDLLDKEQSEMASVGETFQV